MVERSESTVQLLIKGRFSWLLLALVGYILIAGELPDTKAGLVEGAIPMFLVLVAVTFAARGGKKQFIATLVLNVTLIGMWAYLMVNPSPPLRMVLALLLFCSFLFAVLTTLRFVLGEGRVGTDHLCGAVCAYILIAMAFATIYTMQLLADPGAFSGAEGAVRSDRPFAQMIYFSFTTLSTVGYGDIVPTTLRSRSVAIVEQLTGTFYVAVLIGRLAGLYPQRTVVEKKPEYHKPSGG